MNEILERAREELQKMEERYRETFPDLRKAKRSVVCCPRVVAGKRCQEGYPDSGGHCICLRYYNRILDHSRMWIDREGCKVMTSEPYGIDLDVLYKFREECRNLGLTVSIRAYSPYNPGATMMVMIRKLVI